MHVQIDEPRQQDLPRSQGHQCPACGEFVGKAADRGGLLAVNRLDVTVLANNDERLMQSFDLSANGGVQCRS
jgi:hypothetical protein